MEQGVNKSVYDYIENAHRQRISLEHSDIHGKGGSRPRGCEDGSCKICVQMVDQFNKLGFDLVMMKGKGDQLMGNRTISTL